MADESAEFGLSVALEWLRMAHQPFRRASDEEIRELEALRLEAVHSQELLSARVLAEVQLRVMERAFDVLQLSRFANARENHGWMNLFRQWASEAPIREFYKDLSTRCSPTFRSFFEAFIRDRARPIDQDPVPHYWLQPKGSSTPGIFMDSGRTEPGMPPGTRPGAAGIVDHKGSSERDQQYETPSSSAEPKKSAPNE